MISMCRQKKNYIKTKVNVRWNLDFYIVQFDIMNIMHLVVDLWYIRLYTHYIQQ